MWKLAQSVLCYVKLAQSVLCYRNVNFALVAHCTVEVSLLSVVFIMGKKCVNELSFIIFVFGTFKALLNFQYLS